VKQAKTRNPVGWGYIEDAPDPTERKAALDMLAVFLDGKVPEPVDAPVAKAIKLTPGRVEIPVALANWLSDKHNDRLLHALGRSFHDLARLRELTPLPAPDIVATPDSETALGRILEWADRERLAVIPFGGGSSVVGGVTAEKFDAFNGCVSVDLQDMRGLVELDERSRVAEFRGGTLGPDVDAALKPQDLSLRYFPQSYFHSTVGGWVATRGAGHFSTLHAKIEDQVQALRVMLPDGRISETRPLPASSVGIDPNRLWCGSEGFLGIITSARLRIHPRPRYRETQGIVFADFDQALEAAREILQSGLWPAQLRMLDPLEHLQSRLMQGRSAEGALMILGFESGHLPVDNAMQAALAITREHGGIPEVNDGNQGDSVSDWRQAFFRQPYLRDLLMDYGMILDTFETAVPWSRLPGFYHSVRDATQAAIDRICGHGIVMGRTTHAYPDGISLYFSFFALSRPGALTEQWYAIKAAASDAVMNGGGTISHHHAMGRDHKPWARQEIPLPFRDAIRAAKSSLDPNGIMNPGLWFDD